jgi:hypothetical protein
MNQYNLRSLTPQQMDAEEDAKAEDNLKDRVYIEANLDPKNGTFKVTLEDFIVESVPIN